jgi:hypothetical protein
MRTIEKGLMRRVAVGAMLTGLLGPASWTAPPASAQTEGAAPASLDPTHTLHDNLARIAAGKQGVELTLRGGKSYRGRVGKIGDHAVLLTELEGREFYDAWIALDEIAVVELRVRGNP